MTQHNDDIIDDAVEEAIADYNDGDSGDSGDSGEETEDDTEGGLLPFISPVLTMAMIAVAGLVASLKSRKD